MQFSDIPFGLELCRFTGWNQLESDWRNLFAISPDGLFIAELDGQSCGTASAVNYKTSLGWIGMILVPPKYRRKGIASALMNKCIEHLKNLEVKSIKLDATDQGRLVYLKLGFEDEQPIYRYTASKTFDNQKYKQQDMDWVKIKYIDKEAFGADRIILLKNLYKNGYSKQIKSSERDFGYGFAKQGFEASFIGPVVSNDLGAAELVLDGLLEQLPPGKVYIDVLTNNEKAKELIEEKGFIIARELTRMYLGHNNTCSKNDMIFSTSGFELG